MQYRSPLLIEVVAFVFVIWALSTILPEPLGRWGIAAIVMGLVHGALAAFAGWRNRERGAKPKALIGIALTPLPLFPLALFVDPIMDNLIVYFMVWAATVALGLIVASRSTNDPDRRQQ